MVIDALFDENVCELENQDMDREILLPFLLEFFRNAIEIGLKALHSRHLQLEGSGYFQQGLIPSDFKYMMDAHWNQYSVAMQQYLNMVPRTFGLVDNQTDSDCSLPNIGNMLRMICEGIGPYIIAECVYQWKVEEMKQQNINIVFDFSHHRGTQTLKEALSRMTSEANQTFEVEQYYVSKRGALSFEARPMETKYLNVVGHSK